MGKSSRCHLIKGTCDHGKDAIYQNKMFWFNNLKVNWDGIAWRDYQYKHMTLQYMHNINKK